MVSRKQYYTAKRKSRVCIDCSYNILYLLMTDENLEKKSNQFGLNRDLNSELSEFEFSVMNFDRFCALCVQKL